MVEVSRDQGFGLINQYCLIIQVKKARDQYCQGSRDQNCQEMKGPRD